MELKVVYYVAYHEQFASGDVQGGSYPLYPDAERPHGLDVRAQRPERCVRGLNHAPPCGAEGGDGSGGLAHSS